MLRINVIITYYICQYKDIRDLYLPFVRCVYRDAVCCSACPRVAVECCSVLQCVAVCCSGVLQCVAECCSRKHTSGHIFSLQVREWCIHRAAVWCTKAKGIAGCCRVLQGAAGCWRVLQGVAGCCRVLQGVAGCCRVLQGVAGCCRVLQGVAF